MTTQMRSKSSFTLPTQSRYTALDAGTVISSCNYSACGAYNTRQRKGKYPRVSQDPILSCALCGLCSFCDEYIGHSDAPRTHRQIDRQVGGQTDTLTHLHTHANTRARAHTHTLARTHTAHPVKPVDATGPPLAPLAMCLGESLASDMCPCIIRQLFA